LVYGGLPPATDFSGFLTGEWLRFGEGPAISVSPSLLPPRLSPPDTAGTAVEIDAALGLRWRSHGRSDVGRIRVVNEDAFLENPQKGVWAVADGMGGHLAGDVASRAVVDALRTVAPQDGIESLIADVNACLQRTNAALLRRSQADAEGQIMGSTVVILLAVANHCATLWAGDSRLYRFRGGRLSQLTRDHSPDAEGEPAEDRSPEKENSSNVVTRALGAEDDLAVDTVVFEADPGDTYLLCSDGLVKEVNPREIADILNQADPEQSSRALIDLALARGARDNVTVVVVVADQEPAQAPDADPP
jgi:serine/threonine protein phosphatase PrpC